MSRLLFSSSLIFGGTHVTFIFTVCNSDRLDRNLAGPGYSWATILQQNDQIWAHAARLGIIRFWAAGPDVSRLSSSFELSPEMRLLECRLVLR